MSCELGTEQRKVKAFGEQKEPPYPHLPVRAELGLEREGDLSKVTVNRRARTGPQASCLAAL